MDGRMPAEMPAVNRVSAAESSLCRALGRPEAAPCSAVPARCSPAANERLHRYSSEKIS
jgi:hypothetical protein